MNKYDKKYILDTLEQIQEDLETITELLLDSESDYQGEEDD